jgi:hypothetical protein
MTEAPQHTLKTFAWWMSFMLVFWAPFFGEQRIPSLLLLLIGILLHFKNRALISSLPGARVLGAIFLSLLISILITTPFSLVIRESLLIVVVLALHFWAGLAMLSGLGSRPSLKLSIGIGLTLAFWCVDGLIQRFHGSDLFGFGLGTDGRIFGPFGDNQRLGFIIGVMLPVVLWPWVRQHPRGVLGAFLLAIFIIGLGGSRSSLIYAALAGAGLLLRLPAWPQRIALVTLAPMVLVATTLLSPPLKERMFERGFAPLTTADQVASVQPDITPPDIPLPVNPQLGNPPPAEPEKTMPTLFTFQQFDLILSGRLTMWETAWKMLSDRPWVGVGAGAFDNLYDRYATRPDDPFRTGGSYSYGALHAHQLYVSAAAETGIIGLLGLFFAIAIGYRWYRGLAPQQKEQASPYAYSLFIALFPLNSQHSLFIGWWFPILLLLLCGMLAAGSQK